MERTAALLVVSGPGEIHEHAAHQASRHREKVRAILPLHSTNIHQPEVDLVDERGGLEHVARTLARHVPLCEAPQFVVHEREQPLDGPGVAASPFDQEGGHVVGTDIGHGPPILRPPDMTAVVAGLRLPRQQEASGCREGRRGSLVSCASTATLCRLTPCMLRALMLSPFVDTLRR